MTISDLPSPGEAPAVAKPSARKRQWAKRGVRKATASTGIAPPRPPRKLRKPPTRARSVRLPSILWDGVELLAEHFEVPVTDVFRRMVEDGIRAYDSEDLRLSEKCRLGTFRHNPFIKIPDPPAAYAEPRFPVEQSTHSLPAVPPSDYYEPLPPSNVMMMPQGGPPIPREEQP
jgi:hypothetical protein